MKYYFINLTFSALILLISACQASSNGQQKVQEEKNQNGEFQYDLQSPISYTLNSALDEISGITFHSENNDILYAIQDEEGKLFTYSLIDKKITDEFTFGKNADYEDVTTDGKYFYILKSNGDIFYFPFDHKKESKSVNILKNILPKGEYESLAFKAEDNSLYALCKDCKVDKSSPSITGYTLPIHQDGSLKDYTTFSINIDNLKKWNSTISKTIKPSAITYKSTTKEWYIISSIDKILVIADENFNVKNVIPFKRSQFEQPEGLAVNINNDLFISSEMGNAVSAALYQFKLTQ